MNKKIILSLFLLSSLHAEDFNSYIDNKYDEVQNMKNSIDPKKSIDNAIILNKAKPLVYVLSEKFNISEENIEAFILLNLIGKISYFINNDIIYKEYIQTNKKNIETEQEVNEIIDNVLKNKKEDMIEMLSIEDKEIILSVLKDKEDLYNDLYKDFTSSTIKIIKTKITKEVIYNEK